MVFFQETLCVYWFLFVLFDNKNSEDQEKYFCLPRIPFSVSRQISLVVAIEINNKLCGSRGIENNNSCGSIIAIKLLIMDLFVYMKIRIPLLHMPEKLNVNRLLSLEETRSHTLEMVQIFILSFFVVFSVMFFLSFQFCLSFFFFFFVVFFCHFSFVCHFFVIFLSFFFWSFQFCLSFFAVIFEDFFDLIHKFFFADKKMTKFPQNDKK